MVAVIERNRALEDGSRVRVNPHRDVCGIFGQGNIERVGGTGDARGIGACMLGVIRNPVDDLRGKHHVVRTQIEDDVVIYAVGAKGTPASSRIIWLARGAARCGRRSVRYSERLR